MGGIEEIKRHMLALDASGLADALRRLRTLDDKRSAARAWVLRDRTFFRKIRESEPQYTDEERYGAAPWMRMMCLVALCPPVEAARAIRWGDVWDHMRPVARDQAAALVAEQPRAWAESFLATTAQVRLSTSDARHAGAALDWLVERGLAAHDLPCPEGPTFVEHHLAPIRWYTLTLDPERVRQDRLVPDIIYLKIRLGFAAQLAPLEPAILSLVEDGTLERSPLIERCLESLTIDTRSRSQHVVAKILARLELQPPEIPGGLAFLTGVIATRDGAVGARLLPLALELVEDAEGLIELTRVIAGRKERQQKQVLLGALRSPGLGDRVGLNGVLAAADILAAGQEDASLLRALEKLDAELGRAQHTEPAAVPTGLWGLVLDLGPEREWPTWMVHHATHWGRSYDWPDYLDRTAGADARAFEFTADQFLHHLAAHGPDPFVGRCHRLWLDGRLGLNRLVRLVEPAFLAGGLSLLWPAVLGVAEDVASSGTAVAGLPDLLRLLTRYAVDVPDRWSLPAAIAKLARSTNATKSNLEARALEAALARTDPTSLDREPSRDPDARLDPSMDGVPLRGLWHHRQRVLALARVLNRETWVTLHRDLGYDLAVGNGALERHHPDLRRGSDLIALDGRLITRLALAVQVDGVATVRQRVARAPWDVGTDAGPTTDAIRLWLRGELTPDTYWDVLQDRGSAGPSVDRIVFAWTCEQLVRLPSHPGLLSAPSRTDGTIAPSGIARRARALHGVAQVGPLDLLLTLTRWSTGEEDANADDHLVGVQLWTDPAVTRTTSGQVSFDVVPHLRERIEDPTAPIDLGCFWPITAADLSGPASHDEVLRRVWPQDPRFGDVGIARSFGEGHSDTLDNGRLSAEHWSRLLSGLVAGSSWANQLALQEMVMLAAHDGVLHPEVTVPVALDRLRADDLPLSGLVSSLQFVFERGGLRALWPLGLAVAAAVSGRHPKPHGSAALMACLTRYAPEVPVAHRSVPLELAEFAAESGRSKSHAAARDLVTILRSTEGPAS